jgi:hypothetical protein
MLIVGIEQQDGHLREARSGLQIFALESVRELDGDHARLRSEKFAADVECEFETARDYGKIAQVAAFDDGAVVKHAF